MANKKKAIPPVPSKTPKELVPILTSLRENAQVLGGQGRGNKGDQAVTFADLDGSEFKGKVNKLARGVVSATNSPTPVAEVDPMDAPANVAVFAGITEVTFRWDLPSALGKKGYAHTEIYRTSEDNHSFDPDADAVVLIGWGISAFTDDTVEPDSQYYYWVRHVNANGEYGPESFRLEAKTGIPLTQQKDWITPNQLTDELTSRIDLIDDIGDAADSAHQAADKAHQAADNAQARADDARKKAQDNATAISETASKVGSQESKIKQLESVTGEQATSIKSLEAKDKSHSSKIETLESTTTDSATRVSTLETKATKAASDIGKANKAITEHSSKIETLETTTTDSATRVSSLETKATKAASDIGKANKAITGNDRDIANANKAITEHSSKIETLESTTTDSATRVSSLETKATKAASDIGKANKAIAGNDRDIANANKAITEHSSKIETLETTTTDSATRVSSLETKANKAASDIGKANRAIASSSSKIEALESTTASQATRLNQLASKDNTHSSQISSLQTTTTSQARSITQLTSKQNSADGKVSSLEQRMRTAENDVGKLEAQYVVKTDVNGRVAGFGLLNDGKASQMSFSVDQFYIWDGEENVAPFVVEHGRVFIADGQINSLSVNKLVASDLVDENGRTVPSTALFQNVAISQGHNLVIGGRSTQDGYIGEDMLDPAFTQTIVHLNGNAKITGGRRDYATRASALSKGDKVYLARIGMTGKNAPVLSGGSIVSVKLSINTTLELLGTGWNTTGIVGSIPIAKGEEPKIELVIYRKRKGGGAEALMYNGSTTIKFNGWRKQRTTSTGRVGGSFTTEGGLNETITFTTTPTQGVHEYEYWFEVKEKSGMWNRIETPDNSAFSLSIQETIRSDTGVSVQSLRENGEIKLDAYDPSGSSRGVSTLGTNGYFVGGFSKRIADKDGKLYYQNTDIMNRVNTWSGRNKFNKGIDFNNQIIAANGLGNSSNVDHIWYDDAGLGAWHFVADGSVKQQGNADVVAGKFKESGSYLQDKYAAKSHTHNYAPSSHNHDSKYAAKSHTHTQSVLLAKSGSGGWGYLRTQSGSKLWDLAVRDNDSSGAFQIRPQGSNANRFLFRDDGYMVAGSVMVSNWVRTTGNSGWYCESHGGGMHMTDSTWIRVYNGKRLYVSNTANESIKSAGGVWTDRGFYLKGQNLDSRYAPKSHSHNYAASNHTHNYAASAHTHSGHDVRVLGHRMTVDSDGKIRANNSGYRQAGMYGIYDSRRVGHIWSMGTAYKIHAAGSNFGNLYGLAYKHTNNKSGGTMGGGHQMVWCTNGTPRAAMGESGIWSKNNISAYSDARVKTNVVKIPNALDKVCRLNGYTYNRTDQED